MPYKLQCLMPFKRSFFLIFFFCVLKTFWHFLVVSVCLLIEVLSGGIIFIQRPEYLNNMLVSCILHSGKGLLVFAFKLSWCFGYNFCPVWPLTRWLVKSCGKLKLFFCNVAQFRNNPEYFSISIKVNKGHALCVITYTIQLF